MPVVRRRSRKAGFTLVESVVGVATVLGMPPFLRARHAIASLIGELPVEVSMAAVG